MKNEATDKRIREQVNSLNELPEQVVFNRDAAWEKLSMRLQKKKIRPFKTYTLAAAAVLLILVLCGVIYVQEKDHTAVISSTGYATTAMQPSRPVKSQIAPTEKHAAGKDSAIEKTTAKTFHKEKTLPQSSGKELLQPMITDTVQPPVISVAATPPTKPKMKVVNLGDVISEEKELQSIISENRMAAEHSRRFHSGGEQSDPSSFSNTALKLLQTN